MKTTLPTAEDLLYGPHIDGKERTAIAQPKDGAERSVSYPEFYKLVSGCEKFFQKRGLEKGDRVVMLSPNCIELVAAIIASWRLELLAVPVDFRMTAAEAANVGNSLKAELILVSPQFPDVEKLKESFATSEKLVMLDQLESDSDGAASSSARTSTKLDFDALMILTSGTTGVPKGAVHDLRSLIENLKELGQLASLDSETFALLPLPVSHIFGLEVVCACLMYGSTIVFCELEPSKFIASINKYRPQILAGVPTMYGALLGAPEGALNLERARILLSGGAPLPVSLAEEFERKYKKRINNGYGSTESKIIALNLDGPIESIGRPVPSVKVKIINADGAILPEGQEGEIIIDSPHLMKGYLGQPEKTAEVLSAEGYKTGDIGYIKDGYVFISGRAKEMIVVAGNKVFPSEVEEVLLRNPLVREVAVTGPDHKKLGQIVKATIVISDDELSKQLSGSDESKKAAREQILKDLKQFCQENLKRELRPMEWNLRPSDQALPKTRSGKVDKKALD